MQLVAEVTSTANESDQVATLVRAARALSGVTAESIAQAGDRVTLPQLRVLVLADLEGPLNNTAVAAALDVHISNASRICDRLVQAGLLARRDSPTDRRHVELTITTAGGELVSAVTRHRREVFTRILDLMAPQQRSAVAEAMATFATAAEAYVDGVNRYIP